MLIGGLGTDTLNGGAGADRFDFNAVGESLKGSKSDVIVGFNHSKGDRIDVSTIDADTTTALQRFTFIGGRSFAGFNDDNPSVKGLLRYANGTVQGDVNGDLIADFAIKVAGNPALVEGDFIL